MKSKIRYSRYVTGLTAAVFAALFICCIVSVNEKPVFFTVLSIYVLLIICGLFFGVAYIRADIDYVILGSLLKKKKILVRNIESAELFQPTMGSVRIFGSGGFMGYWGIFREGDIGRYYAFYGKASDCFLIRLKNGDKYVLGCVNPDEMVRYIRERMK